MDQTPSRHSDERSCTPGHENRARILVAAIIMLAFPALVLFGSSGRIDWSMAWVYIGMMTVFFLISRIIMLRKNPELIVERWKSLSNRDTKSWDRVLMPLVVILGPTVMLIVAGLDMRFGWSPKIPLILQIIGLLITALGYLLAAWAGIANKFFSGVFRIQRERNHSVITSGPYRFVRHPGYAGGVVATIATPLLLGSLWALVPAILENCLMVIRTLLEDRSLQEELEGYCDYVKTVRYRLIPGIW
jgi:protein-S-isoprenylcysteine O-methyltransferase Ste14